MAIRGWSLNLSSSYSTPGCCASCLGPRETEVKATMSEKSGNIRTTLTMTFPYCNACAKRAAIEKVRQVVVLLLAFLIGAGVPVGAWALTGILEPAIRFALAVPTALGLAVALALVTRQSQPKPPATARGEAVILRDTSGKVLCTNEKFAQLLAEANRTTAKPDSQTFTTEVWAPIAAGLAAVLVVLAWAKDAKPDPTTAAAAPPAATTAADTKKATTPGRAPGPAAPAPKKK